jgi:SPP1 family predicted phage head-tail adaptor
MSYGAGILTHRIGIFNRVAAEDDIYGMDSSGAVYEPLGELWANVTFNKGVKAMREGAMDAYDYIMVRIRYNESVRRDSVILYKRRYWKIESFNEDYREDKIQMTCVEMVGEIRLSDGTVLLADNAGNIFQSHDGQYFQLEIE